MSDARTHWSRSWKLQLFISIREHERTSRCLAEDLKTSWNGCVNKWKEFHDKPIVSLRDGTEALMASRGCCIIETNAPIRLSFLTSSATHLAWLICVCCLTPPSPPPSPPSLSLTQSLFHHFLPFLSLSISLFPPVCFPSPQCIFSSLAQDREGKPERERERRTSMQNSEGSSAFTLH